MLHLDNPTRVRRDGDTAAGPDIEVLGRRRRASRLLPAFAAAAVFGGAALRFAAPAALWLDEAQAVAIASLPLRQLPAALRQDGAPPWYYAILHLWMRVFGHGVVAVRALSAVFGLAAIPASWRVGRRVGGRSAAAAATILVATSPFAIRYSTEARMYALVIALVFAGAALVLDALDRPPTSSPSSPSSSKARLVGIAATTGALLLTHYWGVFLVAAAAAAILVAGARGRPGTKPVLVAMACGALAFVPWVPSLLVQVRHTGAPWGRPPGFELAERVADGFGGARPFGSLLAVLLLAACGAALGEAFGPRGRPMGRGPWLLLVAAATLVLAGISLQLSGDAFAPRHAAVVFPLVALGVAATVDRLRPGPRAGTLAAIAVLGLLAAATSASAPRTQVGTIAAALERQARPGDAVATCPDQLAPSLSRALRDRGMAAQAAAIVVLPAGSPGSRVDWTDYRRRVKALDPAAAARGLDARAGAGTVWLVSSPNYAGVGPRCEAVRLALETLRPGLRTVVRLHKSVFENAALSAAPPG